MNVLRRLDHWFAESRTPWVIGVFLVCVPTAGVAGWLISGWLVGL